MVWPPKLGWLTTIPSLAVAIHSRWRTALSRQPVRPTGAPGPPGSAREVRHQPPVSEALSLNCLLLQPNQPRLSLPKGCFRTLGPIVPRADRYSGGGTSGPWLSGPSLLSFARKSSPVAWCGPHRPWAKVSEGVCHLCQDPSISPAGQPGQSPGCAWPPQAQLGDHQHLNTTELWVTCQANQQRVSPEGDHQSRWDLITSSLQL